MVQCSLLCVAVKFSKLAQGEGILRSREHRSYRKNNHVFCLVLFFILFCSIWNTLRICYLYFANLKKINLEFNLPPGASYCINWFLIKFRKLPKELECFSTKGRQLIIHTSTGYPYLSIFLSIYLYNLSIQSVQWKTVGAVGVVAAFYEPH